MKQRADLTFKHNLKSGRHGWLRLTPAYSIKIVHELLEQESNAEYVLDPFAGTGTTGLVAAERGLHCDLLDINPFLVWLGQVKSQVYTASELARARKALNTVIDNARKIDERELWYPPIRNIERWWPKAARIALAKLHRAVETTDIYESHIEALLLVSFCQSIIDWSNASFGHQSMSFDDSQVPSLFDADRQEMLLAEFKSRGDSVIKAAGSPILGEVCIRQADSRQLPEPSREPYDCVITSPPYPNRMSYIRELRPYMYWLGYLVKAREAGELDWKAIGGTWGIATSRVGKWKADGLDVPHNGFSDVIDQISSTPNAANPDVLAKYVEKYFVDITQHVRSLFPKVESGGRVHYIIGNSKFYNTMVNAERIYASILEDAGFVDVDIQTIRKRNSKKELYEFMVSAVKS